MQYWVDKCIHRDGSVYFQSNAVGLFKSGDIIPVVEDRGEPSCWACNKPIIGSYEKNCNLDCYCDKNIKAIWSDKKLMSQYNRCHITPAQLGGKDTPSNLFLLCPSCHDLSPDTKNRRAFFRWVFKRKKSFIFGEDIETIFVGIDEELAAMGLPNMNDILRVCRNFKYDNLIEFLRKNVGLHGGNITTSTSIVVLADYIGRKYRRTQAEIEKGLYYTMIPFVSFPQGCSLFCYLRGLRTANHGHDRLC